MSLTRKKILKYALLPGLLPRIYELVTTGFYHMAFMVALIYRNVGLLPAGHSYLKPENFGRFGVRHVIAQAANNLVISRRNIDQVIIFFTIVVGFVLLMVQLLVTVFSLIAHPAFAGAWFDAFVETEVGPRQDLAFIVLDQIFGVQALVGGDSFFGSCFADPSPPCEDIEGHPLPAVTSFPTSFHLALHKMFYFYSMGIVVLSVMVIIYFALAVVGETVVSGTPFGQRFNRAWVAPRLLLFFFLIIPIGTGDNEGLNPAQFITLSVAKFGSNFATNAWLKFNDAVAGNTYLGEDSTLVAMPNPPDIGGFARFLFLARLCSQGEGIHNDVWVRPYVVRKPSSDPDMDMGYAEDALPFFDGGKVVSLADAVKFSRYETVTLRFGVYNPPGEGGGNPPGAYDGEWGYVKMFCGEMDFQLTDLGERTIGRGSEDMFVDPADIDGIQEGFWKIVAEYMRDIFFPENAECMARSILPYDHNPDCLDEPLSGAPADWPDTQWLTRDNALDAFRHYGDTSAEVIENIVTLIGNEVDFSPSASPPPPPSSTYPVTGSPSPELARIEARGWAGAALWYNGIADLNGRVAAAVRNVPDPGRWPLVMEQSAEAHRIHDEKPRWEDRFNPVLQSGRLVDYERPGDQYLAALLYAGYSFWAEGDDIQTTVYTKQSQNQVVDFVNMLFGTHGLYDLRRNYVTDSSGRSVRVHPLALLSGLGKGMVDASIRNLFLGVVGEGVGELFSWIPSVGSLGDVAGGFMFTFGMVGLSIGFILYYVLPFVPFLYFFFAFSGWIKSIFEAMVAMPLWALAHIRIDGEGLPGQAASTGYFLLLEIFLRPIMIIMGFLASLWLFSVFVDMLNNLFTLVTSNVGGFDAEAAVDALDIAYWRGPIDEFFFTVFYAIMVYIIGMSCFKLIDQIPSHILRWMGNTTPTFHDASRDPAGELIGQMSRTAQIGSQQLIGMVQRARGLSSAAITSGEEAAILQGLRR